MTRGPAAHVGGTVPIDLPRPRHREALLDEAPFYDLRGQLLDFLENHASQPQPEVPNQRFAHA